MTRRIVRFGGEVLVEGTIPATAVKIQETSIAIAGETGRVHTLKNVLVYYNPSDQEYFVRVPEPAKFEHEEHPSVTVPKGTFRITSVRARDQVENIFVPEEVYRASRTTPAD